MRDYYSNYSARPGAIFKQQNKPSSFRRRPDFRQQQQQQKQLYYEPPRLSELRRTNRLKARKFFAKKKKMHQDPEPRVNAPRNTSSFIMRAKDLGGIASLVSPQLTTPAVLATPDMSRVPIYKEGITDEVSKEWGVNGYGSMNGFIRLRPWEAGRDDASDDSESEVDQDGDQQRQRQRHQQHQQQPNHAVSVQQLETRLDHDLNRFEMVYPTNAEPRDLADTRIEDQESHIAHLEEENLTLKERLYVMEQEMAELRRRVSSREELDSMDEQAEVCCDSDSRPAAASQANH